MANEAAYARPVAMDNENAHHTARTPRSVLCAYEYNDRDMISPMLTVYPRNWGGRLNILPQQIRDNTRGRYKEEMSKKCPVPHIQDPRF